MWRGFAIFVRSFVPASITSSSKPFFVSTIIAAIAVGLLLLWGGIFALLHLVELFERKHVLALGGYTTLVAGLVMGLVLFNSYERQKEHRLQLQEQMGAVTRRLSELSERLVGQLAEKADLTASEFEIRANLQTERSQHANTRELLATSRREYEELEQGMARERKARLDYQQEIDQRLDRQFTGLDERYESIKGFLEVHRRAVQGIQKQLLSVQDDVTRANTQISEVSTTQTNLLGKVSASRQISDLNAQKIEALARNHAALYDDLVRTMAQVDSLYTWKKK